MTKNVHTVLVVEDDQSIRESLRDALETEGYDVVTAENGKDALERLATLHNGRPCLVLLDLMMPVMSGGELLAVIRASDVLATLPVVVVSAWPREAAQLKGQTQGFIKKPVALDALLAAVEQFCNQRAEECSQAPASPPPREL